jgi:ParB/RepB/Spo0J family partition protein
LAAWGVDQQDFVEWLIPEGGAVNMREVVMPLSLDEIQIPEGRREVDPAVVKRLADSIDNVGLRHPITVRRKGEGYVLVAGRHRMEACRKLGRDHVQATIVSMTNAEARMWEIAENLHRAELTKLERAEQIEEWRELVLKVSTPEQPREAGIRKTADELGIDPAAVVHARKIASITPEAKEAAQEAGIDDNQSKLLQVAKEAPERQVAKVIELKNNYANVKTWRDDFERLWAKGTLDDHAWAREFIDLPVMDARYK